MISAAGAALALAFVAHGAAAQISARGGPLDLSGEHSEMIEGEHLIILKGKVEALQGDQRLRTDLLKIYYKAQASGGAKAPAGGGLSPGDIDHIEAVGNVYLVTPTQVVRGDQAVYTAADDTIVVTGKVVLTQGENAATGTRLVVNQTTGHSTLDSDPGGRVRFALYRNETKPADPH